MPAYTNIRPRPRSLAIGRPFLISPLPSCTSFSFITNPIGGPKLHGVTMMLIGHNRSWLDVVEAHTTERRGIYIAAITTCKLDHT